MFDGGGAAADPFPDTGRGVRYQTIYPAIFINVAKQARRFITAGLS